MLNFERQFAFLVTRHDFRAHGLTHVVDHENHLFKTLTLCHSDHSVGLLEHRVMGLKRAIGGLVALAEAQKV